MWLEKHNTHRTVPCASQTKLLHRKGENMGLLGNIVKKKAVRGAKFLAAWALLEQLAAHRSIEALVDKGQGKHILLIEKNTKTSKLGFTVLDKNEKEKYAIKANSRMLKSSGMVLYDAKKCEIGKVTLLSSNAVDVFDVSLKGKKLGTISRPLSIKLKMNVDFNGWHLEGTALGKFTVTDKDGNVVMQFTDALAEQEEIYVLAMNDPENEVLGLLLLMAVEIANA